MRQHEINATNNFISGWYIDDDRLCDSIIAHHSNNPTKHEGKLWLAAKGHSTVDATRKKSDESFFTDVGIAQQYVNNLQKALDEYIKQYPFCNIYSPFNITEDFRIQHYYPNGGFFEWHTERSNNKAPYSARHLVFMTYLNDVTDGGETEFYHQGVKIKPEKGLTLIWPADWTFTHRGNTSPTQEKYIVTGWYNYTN